MNSMIHTSADYLFCSNSSPILELSVKFASQIYHENINKPLDGAYLADFGIDITQEQMVQEREREQGRDNKFINVLVMQTQLVVSENSVKMRQQLS